MEINLSQSDQQQLAKLATQQGFANVEDYIRNMIELNVQADTAKPLSRQDMDEITATIQSGIDEFEATGGHDLDDVMQKIALKHGFSIPS